jgi:hypothetical protein
MDSKRPAPDQGSGPVSIAADNPAHTGSQSAPQRARRGKYEIEALFAAVPLRALIDPRLTDRDVRRLAVIAAFDQMSLATKRGQGAWAGHRTMAAKVGGDGSNESNFSVAVKKLVDLGYLEESRKADDRRRRVYRVVYADEDALFWSKVSSASEPCTKASNPGVDTLLASTTEYIPETRSYSAEAEEKYSTEVARLPTQQARQEELGQPVGAVLAQLERRLSDDPHGLDVEAWNNWLDDVRFDQGECPANVGRATRLQEQLIEYQQALGEFIDLVAADDGGLVGGDREVGQ